MYSETYLEIRGPIKDLHLGVPISHTWERTKKKKEKKRSVVTWND